MPDFFINYFQDATSLNFDIYISGIQPEINELVWKLGGPAKASLMLGVKYSRLKEWHLGRNPISFNQLEKILALFDSQVQEEFKERILSKGLLASCRYSQNVVAFPKQMSADLAYAIGLILGDGSLTGDSSNKKGNWTISVFFDNSSHLGIYQEIILHELGVKTKIYGQKRNCLACCFCSKPFHWFFRAIFGIKNGYKSNVIEIPEIILNSNNNELIIACLQGLFDSDGTVIAKGRKVVKFSSTSEKIARQVSELLFSFGIRNSVDKWLKNERFKMLYTVRIQSAQAILTFANIISFRHPLKLQKLMLNSPVV